MAPIAKRIKAEKTVTSKNDILKILSVEVTGLGYVPEKDGTEALWPCTITYAIDPDIDQHLIGLDDIRMATGQSEIYIKECSKNLISPGEYRRVNTMYRQKPVYEK